MSIILDGKKVSQEIAEKLAIFIQTQKLRPTLAIIQVGNKPESTAFIEQKKKFGVKIGVSVAHSKLDETVATEDVISQIQALNSNNAVHGIIVQLPLPPHINKDEVIEAINPLKDTDGLTRTNAEKIAMNEKGIIPATARGIVSLLDYYEIPLQGKRVAVIGRSMLVGTPVAYLLQHRGASVVVCHKGTINTGEEVGKADIVIVATGSKGVVDSYIHEGQTIVDVGIHVAIKTNEPGTAKKIISGDVDFERAKEKVFAISPVPGGVGPMTVASLFQNVVDACVDNF